MNNDHLKPVVEALIFASPEPITPGTHRVAPTSDVRFRIDSANDHDIAELEKCLTKQPGVIGVQDTMDTT